MQHYWWGEGDEKFFVDGEKMPSTFGTGSEDYFGYAWGTPEAYDSALQAQPRNGAADEIGKSVDRAGPGNIGHICCARWQVADNVPFQKQFEAVIEKYHPNRWPLLNAMTASWYQEAGQPDYYGAMPIEHRKDYYVDPQITKPKPVVGGWYEIEQKSHVTIEVPKGTRLLYQNMNNFGSDWSGDAQVTWLKVGSKNEMHLTIDVKEDTQGIAFALTVAPDYGIYRILLDGEELGKPVDLYGKKVARMPEVSFKDVELKKGKHKITIKEKGKNNESKGNLFGMDYIRIGGGSK